MCFFSHCSDEVHCSETERGGCQLPGDTASIPATHVEVLAVISASFSVCLTSHSSFRFDNSANH